MEDKVYKVKNPSEFEILGFATLYLVFFEDGIKTFGEGTFGNFNNRMFRKKYCKLLMERVNKAIIEGIIEEVNYEQLLTSENANIREYAKAKLGTSNENV